MHTNIFNTLGKALKIQSPQPVGRQPLVNRCCRHITGVFRSFVFQSVIKRTNNLNNAKSQGQKDALPNEEGTELQPIVR